MLLDCRYRIGPGEPLFGYIQSTELKREHGYDIVSSWHISEDLRKKVIGCLEEGHTQESAHKVFKIGLSTIKKWKKRYETTGSLAKKPISRSFKKLDPVKLTAYVKEHPDAYLREIGEVFGCTDDAVRLALIKLGITRKKRRNHG